MSNEIFLDTNGWLAIPNATEQLHDQAFGLWLDLMNRRRRVVLTDWIIAETGNGLAKTQTKSRFSRVVQEMLEAPSVELVVIERNLLFRSLSDYASYTDKNWGLVDCSSFLVMQDHGIADAFTSDRHFEQAGFNCLLKP
jgi:predicted nucleic acid-binding protein